MMSAKQAIQLRDWLIEHSADLEQLATLRHGLIDIAIGHDYFTIQVIHESGQNEQIGALVVPPGVLTRLTPSC